MIAGVQLIGILFALAMIYLTFLYYKRNNYNWQSFVFWLIVWLGFLSLVIFPKTIYGIMETFQIQRTVDFFVICGFLLFAVILFYVFNISKKNERKLEELVRKLAFNEKGGKKKK